jgi:hypothetical protein
MASSLPQKDYFESLPIELHRVILNLLPDFSSLRSVVIASRSAHAAYALESQSIQCNVLRRLLLESPQLSSESRWLHAASYIRRNTPDWQDSMDDFLAYAAPEVDKQHLPDPPAIITPEELRFHIVIEDLTGAFLKYAIQPNPHAALKLSDDTISNLPLQYAEGIRIQRALYRFQRICQMYPRNAQPSQRGARTRGEHPLNYFVRSLPSWELEELQCIYRFLMSRLSFLDDAAYTAFVSAECLKKGISSSRYKEHVLSMGLLFLRQLMAAPFENRLTLLERYCGPDTHPLSDVLPLNSVKNGIGLQASSRSLSIQSLFGPSAGWVLFRPPSPRDRSRMSELQDWGYCFWERDRLEAMGVSTATKESGERRNWILRIRDTGESLQLWRQP